MRTVEHPDKLYIQIYDDNPDTLGLSFNDNQESSESIDPNAFDKETKKRVVMMLANAYNYVVRHMNTGERMKEL